MKKVIFTLLALLMMSTQAYAQQDTTIVTVTVSFSDIHEALQELSTDDSVASLAVVNNKLMVVVSDLEGNTVDVLSIDTLNFPDRFFHSGSKSVNQDIAAVDGNGEVISANPYISTDTEK